MEISSYVHENKIVVLEVKGEVDAYTSQDVDKTLMDLFSQGYQCIVLDISKMTFISSAGIRSILYAHRESVKLGGEVRLVGPTDQVQRIFETVGIYDLIKIFSELQESFLNW